MLAFIILIYKLNYPIVSIQMDGLTCEHCKGISSEFTILRCDHIICAQCLWGEVKAALNGVNTIQCTCGVITKFAPQSNLASHSNHTNANITVATSPRRQTTKNYRTEAATLSVRAPSSPQRSRFIQDRENSELYAELEFLGVQFKKSMEEAQRNFRRVVESIRGKYNNLVKNIRMFWFEEVVESRPILQLPKLLMRKYQKSVGQTLQSLNDSFLQQLTSFRLETQPAPRVSSACKLHHFPKENLPTLSNTCLQQRRKLMQAIDQLKQRGIRKIARRGKPLFHHKN